MADGIVQLAELRQVARVASKSEEVGLGLRLVNQLGETVGEVESLALYVDVDTLIVSGALQLVDIVKHGTAESDDKQVG